MDQGGICSLEKELVLFFYNSSSVITDAFLNAQKAMYISAGYTITKCSGSIYMSTWPFKCHTFI